MTRDELKRELPEHVTHTFTEVDWKLCLWLVQQEGISGLQEVSQDEWDDCVSRARNEYYPASPLAVLAYSEISDDDMELGKGWFSFPMFKSLDEEARRRCLRYALCLMFTAPFLPCCDWSRDKQLAESKWSAEEWTVITALLIMRFYAHHDEELQPMTSDQLAAWGSFTLAAWDRASAIGVMAVLLYIGYGLLFIIARLFAKKQKIYTPCDYWWQVVYRVIHEAYKITPKTQLVIAITPEVFHAYMNVKEHNAVWQELTTAFGLQKAAFEDKWKGSVSRSPIGSSGNAGKRCFKNEEWRKWKELSDKAKEECNKLKDSGELTMEEAGKRYTAIYGDNIDGMVEMASELNDWVTPDLDSLIP